MTTERPTFISISLVSNRPKEFSGLLDNLEKTAKDPSRVELLVRIDDEDISMQKLVKEEQSRRGLKLKFLSMPYTGFQDLYKSFDEMHSKLCDPDAYFVQHINDELRFTTQHWDQILEERYVGLFPDDIYRLKLSMHKLWNYHSIYECGPHPENIPIVTKKWIDLTGWCPCHSADSFQQMLVYYLGLASDASNRCYRDVPIVDIEMTGLEAGLGLESPEEIAAHQRLAEESWAILFSESMQLIAQKKANILRAHIKSYQLDKKDITIKQSGTATHVFDHENKREILTFYTMLPFTVANSNSQIQTSGRGLSLCIQVLNQVHRCINAVRRLLKTRPPNESSAKQTGQTTFLSK